MSPRLPRLVPPVIRAVDPTTTLATDRCALTLTCFVAAAAVRAGVGSTRAVTSPSRIPETVVRREMDVKVEPRSVGGGRLQPSAGEMPLRVASRPDMSMETTVVKQVLLPRARRA